MNFIIRWWFRKELQRLDDVVKVCNERGDVKYCGWSDEAWFAYPGYVIPYMFSCVLNIRNK